MSADSARVCPDCGERLADYKAVGRQQKPHSPSARTWWCWRCEAWQRGRLEIRTGITSPRMRREAEKE